MTIEIPSAYAGRLLRSYLKLTLGLSSAVLAGLKNREDGILINGKRVTVRHVICEGDILTLGDRDTEETATERVIPTDLPLSVLYEDDYVIALAKPADMPTHPSHGHLTDTLANALAYRYRVAEEPFVFRPLGRLDRNTSGVVVVGKTRAAAGCLSRSLIHGEVTKRYLAIVVGSLPTDENFNAGQLSAVCLPHTIDAPIFRPDSAGIRRAVGDETTQGAVRALSRYRILASNAGHSLLLCEPVTGRTHQLRVHLSHIGVPILGDDIYGTPSERIGRHALHAISLTFPRPFWRTDEHDTENVSEQFLTVTAPLPEDMTTAIRSLFGDKTADTFMPI